jgi:hypothetical protein
MQCFAAAPSKGVEGQRKFKIIFCVCEAIGAQNGCRANLRKL